ncbi:MULTISPECIES: hypothetical protein [unclassified Mesorhizobium]|uniref:hypothetical protein n=1 Tax=unclassified Mesorhizobium TaxID=325217 RepID=UPI00167A5776|nr:MULTISPECIES: hypothetical protein [unclassified Mesorhizobium]
MHGLAATIAVQTVMCSPDSTGLAASQGPLAAMPFYPHNEDVAGMPPTGVGKVSDENFEASGSFAESRELERAVN